MSSHSEITRPGVYWRDMIIFGPRGRPLYFIRGGKKTPMTDDPVTGMEHLVSEYVIPASTVSAGSIDAFDLVGWNDGRNVLG